MGLSGGPPKGRLLRPEEFYLGYFSVSEHGEVGMQLSGPWGENSRHPVVLKSLLPLTDIGVRVQRGRSYLCHFRRTRPSQCPYETQ